MLITILIILILLYLMVSKVLVREQVSINYLVDPWLNSTSRQVKEYDNVYTYFPQRCYQYSPHICTADYYRFSLLKNNNTFFIHGLWVEECAECPSCGYPSFCNVYNNNCTFDLQLVQSLLPALQSQWYPGRFVNESVKNNKLIAHEWCKHGLCTNLTEFQFFNTSLALYEILIDEGLLDLCDYKLEECYFIVDRDFNIKNQTIDNELR